MFEILASDSLKDILFYFNPYELSNLTFVNKKFNSIILSDVFIKNLYISYGFPKCNIIKEICFYYNKSSQWLFDYSMQHKNERIFSFHIKEFVSDDVIRNICKNGTSNLLDICLKTYGIVLQEKYIIEIIKGNNLDMLKLLDKHYNYILDKKNYMKYACKNGNNEIINLLIECNCHLTNLSLYYACSNNHLHTVELLIKLNVIITNKSFIIACKNGSYELVKCLVETLNNDIKYTDKIFVNSSAIKNSIISGNYEKSIYLIQEIKNNNQPLMNDLLKNKSLITFACNNNVNINLVKYLIENNFIIDRNTVISCSYNQHFEILEYIISIKDNAKYITKQAISFACQKGNLKMAKLMLNNGGKFDNDIITLCIVVVMDDNTKYDMIKFLLENNAYVNKLDFVFAKKYNNKRIVKLLSQHKSNFTKECNVFSHTKEYKHIIRKL